MLMSLISPGIDSPVASYMLLDYCSHFVHFKQRNSEEVVVKLLERLGKLCGRRLKLFVVDHSRLMEIIRELCEEKETCVYCKSSMLIVAERLAEECGCKALVTGDSLGQVASQTVSNIKAEESLISIPVLRPLIGLDKSEIVEVARKIGTYEISISFKESCPFAPKHPVTKGCYVRPELKSAVLSAKIPVRCVEVRG